MKTTMDGTSVNRAEDKPRSTMADLLTTLLYETYALERLLDRAYFEVFSEGETKAEKNEPPESFDSILTTSLRNLQESNGRLSVFLSRMGSTHKCMRDLQPERDCGGDEMEEFNEPVRPKVAKRRDLVKPF
jgi:hypothetical protein